MPGGTVFHTRVPVLENVSNKKEEVLLSLRHREWVREGISCRVALSNGILHRHPAQVSLIGVNGNCPQGRCCRWQRVVVEARWCLCKLLKGQLGLGKEMKGNKWNRGSGIMQRKTRMIFAAGAHTSVGMPGSSKEMCKSQPYCASVKLRAEHPTINTLFCNENKLLVSHV